MPKISSPEEEKDTLDSDNSGHVSNEENECGTSSVIVVMRMTGSER